MATAEALLTAEEYFLLPDNGQLTELVQGKVVPMNVPAPRHGQICSKIDRIVGNYADEHDLGHVVVNDSGVVTQRDPDTVRGPDVAFYSYTQVPKGRLPRGYLNVVPQLACEVRSPTDRWRAIHARVLELLDAGILVVCVFDEQTDRVHVFRGDDPPEILRGDDEFCLPDLLPGLSVAVRRFFE